MVPRQHQVQGAQQFRIKRRRKDGKPSKLVTTGLVGMEENINELGRGWGGVGAEGIITVPLLFQLN